MGGLLRAVTYIRQGHELDPARQTRYCLDVADRQALRITAWVEYPGAQPDVAVQVIQAGHASVLVVAVPDVLGPPGVQETVIEALVAIGGQLRAARGRPQSPQRPLIDLVARMYRQKLGERQIADILGIDPNSVRALIRSIIQRCRP